MKTLSMQDTAAVAGGLIGAPPGGGGLLSPGTMCEIATGLAAGKWADKCAQAMPSRLGDAACYVIAAGAAWVASQVCTTVTTPSGSDSTGSGGAPTGTTGGYGDPNAGP